MDGSASEAFRSYCHFLTTFHAIAATFCKVRTCRVLTQLMQTVKLRIATTPAHGGTVAPALLQAPWSSRAGANSSRLNRKSRAKTRCEAAPPSPHNFEIPTILNMQQWTPGISPLATAKVDFRHLSCLLCWCGVVRQGQILKRMTLNIVVQSVCSRHTLYVSNGFSSFLSWVPLLADTISITHQS